MKNLLFVFTLSFSFLISAQDSISELLEDYNTESIPYIKVDNLALTETSTILLDAREIREYNTSHLKGAIHVGYDEFDISKVTQTVSDKSSKIVVYCSIGIRSEDIAEELKKEGYTNVYNLFGGIFEWKNNDHTVYDNSNQPTENVHTYSEKWSKWLLKGNKIYD